MFCSKCGAQIPDNAKFCDKCGAPITPLNTEVKQQAEAAAPTAAVNPVQASSQKKKVWPFIVVAIVVVIALIMFFGGGGIDPVETVKQGCLTQYSSTITIEEALNNRFNDGTWSSSESTIADDSYNVIFTGYDPLTEMDWKISFFLEGAGNNEYWISVDNIAAGGNVEYDPTNIYYLMSYVYTGNLNEYYNDIGTALWNAILSGF